MAQEVAEFTSLDDIDRLFCSFWPRFTDSTKTALLGELRPYLCRCATLLPELEPQLFRTKPTKPTSSGIPEDVVAALFQTPPSVFFQRNGRICTELYQAMAQNQDTLWLNVIEQRLRYLGLCKLRDELVQHGCGDVSYISRQKINADMDQYLARGKMYWDLMREFSISAIVGLDPGHLNFYERRKTRIQRQTFISDLKREGARTSAQLARLPESARKLETTAQRYLDWIYANYRAWFAGPKQTCQLNTVAGVSVSGHCHDEANKRRRTLPPSASHFLNDQPIYRKTTVDTGSRSTVMPQFGLDVLADTALLIDPVVTRACSQAYETDSNLLNLNGMTVPGSVTTSHSPSTNPLPPPSSCLAAPNLGSYTAASRMSSLSDRRATDASLLDYGLCASISHGPENGMGLCSDDAGVVTPSNIMNNIDTDSNDIHPAIFTGADFGLHSGENDISYVDVHPTIFTGASFGLTSDSEFGPGFFTRI